jgi:transposase-like protein
MHTTINTEGTALLFLKEVWKHHRTPRVVISDRVPQFVTAFTCELYKLLQIFVIDIMIDIDHPSD